MKIQGPNPTNISAYKQQLTKQPEDKQVGHNKDEINISDAAKKMQEMQKTNTERTEYVTNIKKAIQSGQYEVDLERTSEKMIDYWSRRS